MRQSNIYIILYTTAITVVCGGVLAFASLSLRDRQNANILLEKKKNILSLVLNLKESDNVTQIYDSNVKASVIDFEGNAVKDIKAEDVVLATEYKKKPSERLLPIYEFKDKSDSTKIEFAVMPVYGFGLWNNIWGYVAVKSDLNTIQGVKFAHAGETPGLGARITTEEVGDRFKNKTIFENGNLVSVIMQKGEGQDYSNDSHKVDGMSGATLTGKGVTNMLKDYLLCYENFLKKNVKPKS